MLPISLQIEGLNSYANPISIDFTKFYSKRIFGIFGDTGSGKSTIIDAIILALYGKTPRLGKDITEAINPSKKQIKIDFTFSISGKKYKIERNIGKNSKIKLSELNNERSKTLAERKTEFDEEIKKIIGLSEEEFCKVVILPQNQFSEILKINPSQRAQLIGNLFDLNIYGEALYNVISNKSISLENKKKQIEMRLCELNSLSEELIQSREKEIKQIKIDLDTAHKEQRGLTERLQVIESFIKLNSRLSTLQADIKRLEQQSEDITKIKDKLRLDEELSDSKRDYGEWINLRQSIEQNQLNREILNKDITDKQSRYDEIKKGLKDFEEYYNKRLVDIAKAFAEIEQCSKLDKKLQDLEKDYKALTAELSKLTKNLEDIDKVLITLQKDIDIIEKIINDNRSKLEKSRLSEEESQLYDKLPAILSEIKLIEGIESEARRFSDNLAKSKNKYQNIVDRLKGRISTQLLLEVDNPKEINDLLDTKIKTLRAGEEGERQRLKGLEIKDMAFTIRQYLKTGEPCPVCGSLEHPNPVEGTTQDEIKQIEQNIKAYQENIKLIEKIKGEIKEDLNSLISLDSEIEQTEGLLKERQAKLSSLKDKLRFNLSENEWHTAQKIFDDLKVKKDKYDKTIEELNKLNTKLTEKNSAKLNKTMEKAQLQADISNKNERLRDIQKEINEIKSELSEKTSGKKPDIMKKELENEKDELNNRREALHRELKDLGETLNNLNLQLQSITTALNKDISRHQALTESLSNKAHQLNVNIEDLRGFFIDDELKVKLKNDVHEYETKLNILRGEIEGVRRQIDELPIKSIEHDERSNTEKRLMELNKRIADLNKNIGAITEKIEKERQDLEEKKKLSKDLENIKREHSNAERLKTLIRGKEMVKFLSWYLLTDIVKLTNEFLKDLKMGKRFIVNVNSNLDITIRDLYYNKDRPVTTLSGGETFILSFALALALSNFIQGKRKKSIGFFFIDEGFSSLDKDLLDAVGNVLNQLSSQDRLVGLISHLDELKQLIPTYIYVKKDVSGSSQVQLVY